MWLFMIILGALISALGVYGYKNGWFRGMNPPLIRKVSIFLGAFLIVFGILLTSFVFTPTKHTTHLVLKYGSGLEDGRVIAINGERGRQARVLQEGLNFSPFIRVLYDYEHVPYEVIPEGKVGLLTSIDGLPLGKDLFTAPDWVPDGQEQYRDSIERNMLDPVYFIKNDGRKGPQLNVLKPGEYKINKYLWKVDIVDATRVPDGYVGVIISRVGKVPENIEIEADSNNLATPVVDKGYMGIWKDVLKPGMYYLNTHPNKNKGAYEVKLIPTRVQTWTYKGGYNYYKIDLTINEDGTISSEKSKDSYIETPANAADKAITVIPKDGWDVVIDSRLLVQIQPVDAPYVVASVGNEVELENKIATPLLRSVLRNIAETKNGTQFVFERSKIEDEVDIRMKEKSNGSRLTIKEYKMNGVFIKPELLVPDKRKQLASKLKETYTQEKLAYEEKKRTENAREEAEQQDKLVEAKIAKQAAADYKEAERLRGEGNKLRMIEEAIGQRELAEVLGIDKTYGLEMAKTLRDYPDAAWNTPFLYNAGGGTDGAQTDAYTGITIKQMMSSMNDLGIESTAVEDYVNEYNKKSKKAKESKEKRKVEKPKTNNTNKTDAQKTVDALNSK